MAKRKMPVNEEVAETVIDSASEKTEEPVVEKKTKAATIGVVTGCLLLNVREKPDKGSAVLEKIKALEEVKIRSSKNEEWYAVTTSSGVKGFCMKKFIAIK